jgi:hypothetical protein
MFLPSLTSLTLESFLFRDRAAFGGVNTGLQGFLQRHLTASSRLSEVVLYRCSSMYGSDLTWAVVYDKFPDFVSLSSHSTLKSFNHTPNAWILQGENYLRAGYLVNNVTYYVTVGQQKTQALLDLEAYRLY